MITRFFLYFIYIYCLLHNSSIFSQFTDREKLAPTSQAHLINISLDEDTPNFLSEEHTIEEILHRYGSARKDEISEWISQAIEERQIARIFRINEHGKIQIVYRKIDLFFAKRETRIGFLPDSDADPDNAGVFGLVVKDGPIQEQLRKLVENTNDSNLYHARTMRLLRNPVHQKRIFRKYAHLPEAEFQKHVSREIDRFKEISFFLQENRSVGSRALTQIDHRFRTVFEMSKADANIESILRILSHTAQDLVEHYSAQITNIPRRVNTIERSEQKAQTHFFATAEKIKNYPFMPQPAARFALQNYYNILIQLSTDQPEIATELGHPNRDILLLALIDKIEDLKSITDPETAKKATKEAAELYAPLSEWLGLNDIANQFRELAFEAEYPGAKQALEKAILNVFGMDYENLHRYLQGQLSERLMKAIKPLNETYHFEIHARVKSLHSLWEKLQSIAKDEHNETLDPNRIDRIEYYLRGDYKTLPEKKGKKRRYIDDILGLQIIYVMPKSTRTSRALVHAEETIMTSIMDEFNRPDARVLRTAQKILVKHGYQEGKLVPEWTEGTVNMKAEIQILSNRDLVIYRYGNKAHWTYKVNEHRPRDRKYRFDDALLERLQFKLTGDLHEDFNTLFHEISKDNIYLAVILEHKERKKTPEVKGKKSATYFNYSRLPRDAIVADAAASRDINLLLSQMIESYITHDELPVIDQDNQITAQRTTKRTLSHALSAGDILQFVETERASIEISLSDWENIFRHAQHGRTIMYSQMMLKAIEEARAIREGEEKLHSMMRSILQDAFPELSVTEVKEFIEDAILEAADYFRFLDPGELYLLASIVDQSQSTSDQRLIVKIINNFRRDALNETQARVNLDFLKDKFGYTNRTIPRDFHLEILATYLLAETMGKITLQKAYETNLLRDIGDLSMDEDPILDAVIQELGLQNIRQLYCRIARELTSITEIAMIYNKIQTQQIHSLKINFQEDQPGLILSISKVLEDIGITILNSEYTDAQATFEILTAKDPEKIDIQLKTIIANIKAAHTLTEDPIIRPVYTPQKVLIAFNKLPRTRGTDRGKSDITGLRISHWITSIEKFASKYNLNIVQKNRSPESFVIEIPGSLTDNTFKTLLIGEISNDLYAPEYLSFGSLTDRLQIIQYGKALIEWQLNDALESKPRQKAALLLRIAKGINQSTNRSISKLTTLYFLVGSGQIDLRDIMKFYTQTDLSDFDSKELTLFIDGDENLPKNRDKSPPIHASSILVVLDVLEDQEPSLSLAFAA